MKTKTLITLVGLVSSLAFSAQAAVPDRVNFQGRLLDSSKLPKNGTFSMTFRVCDSAASDCSDGSGGQLWHETQNVSVANGVFAVQLGASTALTSSAFTASTRYLEIIVAGETLSPRERLVATPYSHRASVADGLDTNALTADDQIAAGANITDAKLAQITTAGKVSGAALTSLGSIPGGAGNVPAANIDGSSVTKMGNTFNGANGLVKLDGSTRLPAVDGSLLTNVGGSVVADSPLSGNGTAGSHLGVDASSVTLLGNTFNGNNNLLKLSGSALVPNANVDTSSVTKMGNTFNGNDNLLKLSGTALVPNANVDTSSVTKMGNTFNGNDNLLKLSGTALVPNANVDTSSVTKMGNTFNAANLLVKSNASNMIIIGWNVVTQNATGNVAGRRAGCGAAATLISGGCYAGAAQSVIRSFPSSETTSADAVGTQSANGATTAGSWSCTFSAAATTHIAYAICGRLAN